MPKTLGIYSEAVGHRFESDQAHSLLARVLTIQDFPKIAFCFNFVSNLFYFILLKRFSIGIGVFSKISTGVYKSIFVSGVSKEMIIEYLATLSHFS